MINDCQINKWQEFFDSNDASVLLTAIANKEIKIEVMIDSICALSIGNIDLAKDLYEEMWR